MSSPRHNVDSCIIGHRSYILLCRREKLHFFLTGTYIILMVDVTSGMVFLLFIHAFLLWRATFGANTDAVFLQMKWICFFTQILLNVTCFIMCFFNKKQNHAQLSFTRTLSSEPFSKAIVMTQIYDLTLHKPNLHICPLSQNK